ncbi:4Fe-4S dicluster domain-containing protein [Mixta calida]|uniref:4Fe-4S dicluster domain-containing protein n=1 Tax=Mixta calida TaxID=665913 RepID=UPI00289CB3F5|nr:4Fe-4S dicluster domain-containing protein [Mixta calida]
MTDFILVNPALCIGCRTCEIACVMAHPTSDALSPARFAPRLTVTRLSRINAPVMCRQCENAPCVAACPTAALTMGECSVEANATRCIGCKSCIVACPFGCIAIQAGEKEESRPVEIVKCDLCASHQEGPACVAVCPTRALKKVTAAELDSEKQQRMKVTAAGSFYTL